MSTEGDSAMQPPAAAIETTVVTEPTTEPALPVPERTVSNEEAMIAQVLSRTKKNAKQLERAARMVEQVLGALKKADKERVKHSKQVEQQNKKILSQLAQLQKQVKKAKASATPKRAAKKGKKKAIAKRR
ncbi:MAG: hypothetical protein ABI347_03070 [Nitrososphaera sp.]|jgi:hypothetical protein